MRNTKQGNYLVAGGGGGGGGGEVHRSQERPWQQCSLMPVVLQSDVGLVCGLGRLSYREVWGDPLSVPPSLPLFTEGQPDQVVRPGWTEAPRHWFTLKCCSMSLCEYEYRWIQKKLKYMSFPCKSCLVHKYIWNKQMTLHCQMLRIQYELYFVLRGMEVQSGN